MRAKARELGLKKPPALAPAVLDRLVGYDWPGNVRELENVIERALIHHRQGALLVSHLNLPLASQPQAASPSADAPPATLEEVAARHIQEVLRLCRGKVNGPDGAAAILGLHPSTLRHRMRKAGIPFGRPFRKP
jgi:DNA-binding NtrC family response regulator